MNKAKLAELIELIKPIVNGTWYCEDCASFIPDSEVGINGDRTYYCKWHSRTNLSDFNTRWAYEQRATEVIEALDALL